MLVALPNSENQAKEGGDMIKRWMTVIVIGFLLQGCASTLRLEPKALKGQRLIYQEGVESIISKKETLVAIRPAADTYMSAQRPTLIVTVFNSTGESFILSTDNIKVFMEDQPLKVFTHREIQAEIRQQQAWAAVAVALSGAAQTINAQSAGQTYHSGTYNATVFGQNGYNAHGYGSYAGYSYNPAAALQAQAAANAQTMNTLQAIENQTEQALNKLGSTMLKKTTVFPRSWYGGSVKFEKITSLSKNCEIKVIVTAAGEQHEFALNLSKVEQKNNGRENPVGQGGGAGSGPSPGPPVNF